MISIMLLKLVHVCFVLLIVTFKINAQAPRDYALHQRAQSLEPHITEAAKRHSVDPRILRVLCYLESRYRLDAVSPKGARGPMQFMPQTAARYGLTNPHDPKAAIEAAARYMRDLLRRFEGRIDLALAAYNAGEGTVEAYKTGRTLRLANGRVINAKKLATGGIPPYRETQNYVRSAIHLLTTQGLVTKASRALVNNTKVPSIRDFTIDVSAGGNSSATHSAEATALFFIEVP
jgi:soluble lytic murein transglycosylase-like protein